MAAIPQPQPSTTIPIAGALAPNVLKAVAANISAAAEQAQRPAQPSQHQDAPMLADIKKRLGRVACTCATMLLAWVTAFVPAQRLADSFMGGARDAETIRQLQGAAWALLQALRASQGKIRVAA